LFNSAYLAVLHYENKAEQQFFHNKEALRLAICKAWQMGAFEEKRRIIYLIEAAGF